MALILVGFRLGGGIVRSLNGFERLVPGTSRQQENGKQEGKWQITSHAAFPLKTVW
jgi:hypothetical protein